MAEKLNIHSLSPSLNASLDRWEKVLVRKLQVPLYTFFTKIYDTSRDSAKEMIAKHYKLSDKSEVSLAHVDPGFETLDLRLFQEAIKTVPVWTTDTVREKQTEILANVSGDLDLDKVLKFVFIANAMVLASMRENPNEKIQLSIPAAEVYMHRVLINIAKELFNNPILIRQCRGKHVSAQMSMDAQVRVNHIIAQAVKGAIYELLPLNSIFDSYLHATICDVSVKNDTGMSNMKEFVREPESPSDGEDGFDDEDEEDDEDDDEDDDDVDEEEEEEVDDDDVDEETEDTGDDAPPRQREVKQGPHRPHDRQMLARNRHQVSRRNGRPLPPPMTIRKSGGNVREVIL